MSQKIERIKVLSAGIASLILMLGIARFAYTPLLPLMQQQANLGLAEAGWLASINYMGYLSGAIIASLINSLVIKDRLYRIGLIVAIVTTAGMALSENIWLWSLLRFFAGLSSAAGLLLGSGLILNWLIRHNHRGELGIHFSGLGLGIALCAIAVELLSGTFDWREQWLFFSVIGGFLLIPAWLWLPPPDSQTTPYSGQDMHDRPPSQTFMRLFMAAYFCAGAGYVISATFIVAIVEQLPDLQGKGSLAFMVLGLAAAPACIIWDFIARKVGNLNALISAFLAQIVGILLPIIEPNLFMTLLGAMLFGGTFIGIVSLVLTMAGHFYPTRPAKMMGKMTITYGIAQIIAPLITALFAQNNGSYNNGLYLAAAMMTIGTFLMIRLKILASND
jgi:predicted MFS family arabinose efflux permease